MAIPYINYVLCTYINFGDRCKHSFSWECLPRNYTPSHNNILWIWLISLLSALSCNHCWLMILKTFLSYSCRRMCWIWLVIGNFHGDQDFKKMTIVPKTPESGVIGELTWRMYYQLAHQTGSPAQLDTGLIQVSSFHLTGYTSGLAPDTRIIHISFFHLTD